MSTEARLKRLGLFHLKDDPVALGKAMDAMMRDLEAKEKHAQENFSTDGQPGKQRIRLDLDYKLLLYANRFDQDERGLFNKNINQLSPYTIHAVFYEGANIYVVCDDAANRDDINHAVTHAGQMALERLVKWHKKKDAILAVSFLLVYVLGALFFSEAYSQTHGLVSTGILIIAFGLLFVPWWIQSFKSFVEKYLIGKP